MRTWAFWLKYFLITVSELSSEKVFFKTFQEMLDEINASQDVLPYIFLKNKILSYF